jgi:hypothetical protein
LKDDSWRLQFGAVLLLLARNTVGSSASRTLIRAIMQESVFLAEHKMAQTVEISLRIPSLRIRRQGKEDAETIANGDVRFGKRVELTAIPKPGDILTMTVSSGGTFECDVVRSDWQHDKDMFVIACRYSKRSISHAEYQALVGASDWQVRPLL